MTVGIYQSTGSISATSTGDSSNPIVIKASNAGSTEERQLFLRHESLSGEEAQFSADVTVGPIDIATVDDDVSTWIQIAPDNAGVAGTYGSAGAAVNLGNVNLGDVVPFWAKFTVPATSEVGARDDLKLNLTTSSTNTISTGLVVGNGQFIGQVFWDETEDRIHFQYQDSGDTGEWISEWIDVTSATEITGLTYTIDSGTAFPYYRTADDNTGTNASAWISDAADLNLTQNFLQCKLFFKGQDFIPPKGLTQYWYSGTSFNNLVATRYGLRPYDDYPGDSYGSTSFSIKWFGYFWAHETGTYNFRIDTDDGQRLYIDEVLRIDAFAGGPRSHNVNVTLSAGWHSIEYQFYQGSGGQYIYSYVTPSSQAFRAVQTSDYTDDRTDPRNPTARHSYVSDVELSYTGAYDENFDVRIYMGPATPELIAPEEGFLTNGREFNPDLTAVSARCDAIQFQLDNVTTFDSAEVQTWEVPASDDVEVTSQSPVEDRAPGVWYWRARAKLDGVYGVWSDYRTINIAEYAAPEEFYYINSNVGLEFLMNDEFYYLNVNVGERVANPYNKNHIYINVNVGTGAGEVIYPLYDKTTVRKTTFAGDGDMFT